MSKQQNITRIKAVHGALDELKDHVVFVGGATVALYADRQATESRPTEDVDIVVELTSYASYAALEETLRSKGFINDITSGVICRYKIQGIIVDVMPTTEGALGFSNKWYHDAIKETMSLRLDDHYAIRVFKPEYFLATKIEAYKARGKGDGRMSSDFEDIVYILNNRSTIWLEITHADGEIRDYLTTEFKALLENPYINEWVSAHLDYHEQRRIDFIIESMRDLVQWPYK